MINIELAKEFVCYDGEHGVFTWNTRCRRHFDSDRAFNVWNSRFAGNSVGCEVMSNGKPYMYTRILSAKVMLHNLAWVIYYGSVPSQLDHVDGDGTNNKIHNLREFSQAENNKNTKKRKDNKSGVTGVSLCKATSKWKAYINDNKKRVWLGVFNNINDAKAARIKAEVELGYHENHGK